jgi:hypothetical protein
MYVQKSRISKSAVRTWIGSSSGVDGDGTGALRKARGARVSKAIAEIAQACGQAVDFVRVAPRDYTAALTRGGVPADFASLITYLFTELVEGRNAAVGDGVERALARRPADFRDYARGCAARGVWPPRVRRLHRAGEAQERTVMIEA